MIKHIFHVIMRELKYKIWFKKNYPKEADLTTQKNYIFDYAPLISVIIPVYNTPLDLLKETLTSVFHQTYSNWEICIADGSKHSQIEDMIRSLDIKRNINYIHLSENLGISENTNAALSLATGEFICLLDHDDLLAPSALYEIVKSLNEHPNADILYSDEDKINSKGTTHSQPYFKSDFNLDLLRCNNYICHLFCVKRSIVDEIGGFSKEYDGAQDYDFILRCVDHSSHVYHIPKILYHWRIHENSVAANPDSKKYAYEAGKRAILSHLERHGLNAKVKFSDHPGFYKIEYLAAEHPLVSVIRFNPSDSEYFVKLNEAAAMAEHPYLLFLDDNISLDNNTHDTILNCLDSMLAITTRNDVGIVGTKLLYANGTVLSAGYYFDKNGSVRPGFCKYDGNDFGYFGRLQSMQNVSLLSHGCLLIRKELFEEIGGFSSDYTSLYGAFDLCMRVKKAGFKVVLMADTGLNISAGSYYDEYVKNTKEKAQFYDTHKIELSSGDSCYNPNCSLKRGNFDARV